MISILGITFIGKYSIKEDVSIDNADLIEADLYYEILIYYLSFYQLNWWNRVLIV